MSVGDVPFEEVSGVVDLVFLHVFVVDPDACLDEMDADLLRVLELDCEPVVGQGLNLEDELEQ